MNKDLSNFIRHALDREITMVSVYVDDFLFTLNYLITLNILKKVLGSMYSI